MEDKRLSCIKLQLKPFVLKASICALSGSEEGTLVPGIGVPMYPRCICGTIYGLTAS